MKSISSKQIIILPILVLIGTLTVLAVHSITPKTSKNEMSDTSQGIIRNDEKSYQGAPFPDDYIAHHFDYPVGTADGNGYYNAQGFAENNHLGDDWNGTGGGNTDFGDPIYAIADGRVKAAEDHGGGWGNIVRILHQLPNGEVIESFYAHCETMMVKEGDWIKRGDQIATIGNADGAYLAHLHFEIRTDTSMGIGGGYSSDTEGYVDPTAFIRAHR